MSHTFQWCHDKTKLAIFGKQVMLVNIFETKYWYLNGKRHRKNGPAVEYANGDKWWYLNGEWHRENGPAIEWADGDMSWYLNGKLYTESEYWKELQK